MTQKTNQGGLGSSKEWETEKKVKNIPDAMKIMKINFIAIVVLTLVCNLEESNNDIIFSRCKANETRKDLRFGRSFENQMKTEMIKMKKQFRKKNLRHKTRKKINKSIHMEEGNRRKSYLITAWWNNKSGQNHQGKKTRDSLAAIISKHDIDIIGISESNISKEDDKGINKIKSYDLINDKILQSGKSRSSIYVKSKLKYPSGWI